MIATDHHVEGGKPKKTCKAKQEMKRKIMRLRVKGKFIPLAKKESA